MITRTEANALANHSASVRFTGNHGALTTGDTYTVTGVRTVGPRWYLVIMADDGCVAWVTGDNAELASSPVGYWR